MAGGGTETAHDGCSIELTGAAGNRLRGDLILPQGAPIGTVLLLHGGGQTRHAWRSTGRLLADEGWIAVAMDQRGHGDSDWVASGDYSFQAYAEDASAMARALSERFGFLPVCIGASLGGNSAMIAAGTAAEPLLRALILVDITPKTKPDGSARIVEFMRSNAIEGFASLEEAADAISTYLPHRPRPKSLDGLRRNLREGSDGRFRWHWDPRFVDSRKEAYGDRREIEASLVAAARRLRIPVLLVRGGDSELVGEAEVSSFLEDVPHAEVADVQGARHMVAGDDNDIFTATVLRFLRDAFGQGKGRAGSAA